MLCVVGQCAPTKLSLIVLSVGVLVYSVAHNICHKHCSITHVYIIIRLNNIELDEFH